LPALHRPPDDLLGFWNSQLARQQLWQQCVPHPQESLVLCDRLFASPKCRNRKTIKCVNKRSGREHDLRALESIGGKHVYGRAVPVTADLFVHCPRIEQERKVLAGQVTAPERTHSVEMMSEKAEGAEALGNYRGVTDQQAVVPLLRVR
jgi:hypothetical protein